MAPYWGQPWGHGSLNTCRPLVCVSHWMQHLQASRQSPFHSIYTSLSRRFLIRAGPFPSQTTLARSHCIRDSGSYVESSWVVPNSITLQTRNYDTSPTKPRKLLISRRMPLISIFEAGTEPAPLQAHTPTTVSFSPDISIISQITKMYIYTTPQLVLI